MQQARKLRIMQVVFIVYVLLLFWFIRRTPAAPGQPSMTLFAWAIVFIALSSAVLGFVFQKLLLRAPSNPQAASKSTPVKRWFLGHLIRMAFSVAVSLYGIVLHTTGAPNSVALSLIGLGLVLILFWSPGEIPGGEQLSGQ